MTFTQIALAAPAAITIESVGLGVTTIALVGFWREQRALRDDIRVWQSKINTTLFGPNGDNGLNGTSKDHETRLRHIEDQDRRLVRMENNGLGSEVRDHEARIHRMEHP